MIRIPTLNYCEVTEELVGELEHKTEEALMIYIKVEAREYVKRHPEAAFHIWQLMAIIETKRALE